MKVMAWWLMAGALAICASQRASGQVVIFNSGGPDGKMAMASRPGPASGANQETEAAESVPSGE